MLHIQLIQKKAGKKERGTKIKWEKLKSHKLKRTYNENHKM